MQTDAAAHVIPIKEMHQGAPAEVPFPEVVDSTILGSYGRCPRHAYWGHFRFQAPEGENIHLHAGSCYARGLEVARLSYYRDGKPSSEAILDGAEALVKAWGSVQAPEGSAKSIDRTLSAYEYYFSSWPLETDYIKPLQTAKGPAVEFNFVLPLEGTAHPVTGAPILYAGRFDMLGVRDNVLFICDDKTTSSLGATWGQQWKLRAQFTGYCWGARSYGHPVAGAVVRGVSILKRGHDKQEAIVHRPEWMIENWLQMVRLRLDDMILSWERNFFTQDFDHGCTQYGPCPYMLLCDSPNPEAYLQTYYKYHKWDPTVRPMATEALPQ